MSANPLFVYPLLTEEEAKSWFINSSSRSFLSRIGYKRKQWIRFELVYLPYFVFTYGVHRENENREVTVAVDGLCGTFTYFDLSGSYEEDGKKKTLFAPKISMPEAEKLASQEYQMNLLQTRIQGQRVGTTRKLLRCQLVYYPYWVGYFKRKGVFDFQTLDGVNGRSQGIRMRKVFLAAFTGRQLNNPK